MPTAAVVAGWKVDRIMVEWGPCKAVRVLQQKGGAGSANFSCNPAIFQAHKAET